MAEQEWHPHLNAPTTLPPSLELPMHRDANGTAIRHYMKVGKGYLNFYKTAVKHILANRKTAKLIRALFPDDPLLENIPGDSLDHKTGKFADTKNSQDVPGKELSRANYQLLRRLSRDLKKVPVFIILLAVFGEWLPLFVVLLDPLLPQSALLSSQVLKWKRRIVKFIDPENINPLIEVKGNLEQAGIHDRAQLLAIARRLGLLGPISQHFRTATLLRRIRNHEAYLAIDDKLILRGLDQSQKQSDRMAAFTDAELQLALEERGLWMEDQSITARRVILAEWLDYSKASHQIQVSNRET